MVFTINLSVLWYMPFLDSIISLRGSLSHFLHISYPVGIWCSPVIYITVNVWRYCWYATQFTWISLASIIFSVRTIIDELRRPLIDWLECGWSLLHYLATFSDVGCTRSVNLRVSAGKYVKLVSFPRAKEIGTYETGSLNLPKHLYAIVVEDHE